jgi:hypothetical protein
MAGYSSEKKTLFSVVSLDKCVRNFSSFTGCSLGEAIKCATYNPARSVYIFFHLNRAVFIYSAVEQQGVWGLKIRKVPYGQALMRIWSYLINKVLFSVLGLWENKLGRKA